jgi:hypothetical protein
MAKKEKHEKGGKGGKMRTGHIRHGDMTSYIDGVGGQDPVAHSSHKEMNKKHHAPEGMSPKGDYDQEGGGCCKDAYE